MATGSPERLSPVWEQHTLARVPSKCNRPELPGRSLCAAPDRSLLGPRSHGSVLVCESWLAVATPDDEVDSSMAGARIVQTSVTCGQIRPGGESVRRIRRWEELKFSR